MRGFEKYQLDILSKAKSIREQTSQSELDSLLQEVLGLGIEGPSTQEYFSGLQDQLNVTLFSEQGSYAISEECFHATERVSSVQEWYMYVAGLVQYSSQEYLSGQLCYGINGLETEEFTERWKYPPPLTSLLKANEKSPLSKGLFFCL